MDGKRRRKNGDRGRGRAAGGGEGGKVKRPGTTEDDHIVQSTMPVEPDPLTCTRVPSGARRLPEKRRRAQSSRSDQMGVVKGLSRAAGGQLGFAQRCMAFVSPPSRARRRALPGHHGEVNRYYPPRHHPIVTSGCCSAVRTRAPTHANTHAWLAHVARARSKRHVRHGQDR